MDIDLDKPLCIDVKTVIKCERKHSLDLSFVSHIDDYIRESCLAFESLTQETSIVFVLNRKSDTFELPYIMSNTYTAYICMPKRHSFPLSPYVQAVSRRYFISMQLQ